MGFCVCSMFYCSFLFVLAGFAIILMGKLELFASLYLFSLCLVMVFVLCAVDWSAVCDCGIFLPHSLAKCNHLV